jgi:hypothetical protein
MQLGPLCMLCMLMNTSAFGSRQRDLTDPTLSVVLNILVQLDGDRYSFI